MEWLSRQRDSPHVDGRRCPAVLLGVAAVTRPRLVALTLLTAVVLTCGYLAAFAGLWLIWTTP